MYSREWIFPRTKNGFTNMMIPNIPFILNIGVTGHRNIENSQSVSKAVRESLVTIITSFKLKEKAALVLNVISPLAEGADRIIVNEALKLEDKYRVNLKVVLPFIIDEYEKDFSNIESIQVFHKLLDRADEIIYIRQTPFDSSLTENKRSSERKECYLKTGIYVVDNSDLVIAIWDRKPAKGIGGTGEIVQYAKKQKRDIIIINPISLNIEERIN